MGADMRYCSCCVTVVRNSVSFHLACDFLASAASRLKVNFFLTFSSAATLSEHRQAALRPLSPLVWFQLCRSTYAAHMQCTENVVQRR